ncbi:class I SAM-dependent methyltransferase [Patescibacteria group bacterium]|nr:class I SAM-dependent methyltransferase [Patescibacteria group bacterium]MBU1728295.1 class I SAM-dependent methyltransferase [Patescibacteria group bacterium]
MFSDPIKNLKQFGLSEDMVVVDLGAGSGFYSVPLAQMVPKGKVYAIEIQRDFLNTIKNRIKEFSLSNIECILGDVEKKGGTKIGDAVADAVVVSNVLFQAENKDRFVEEVARILKPEGKVLVIDWSDDSSIISSGFKIIPEEKMREMFGRKGFIFNRTINAGKHHYGMIFKKE